MGTTPPPRRETTGGHNVPSCLACLPMQTCLLRPLPKVNKVHDVVGAWPRGLATCFYSGSSIAPGPGGAVMQPSSRGIDLDEMSRHRIISHGAIVPCACKLVPLHATASPDMPPAARRRPRFVCLRSGILFFFAHHFWSIVAMALAPEIPRHAVVFGCPSVVGRCLRVNKLLVGVLGTVARF